MAQILLGAAVVSFALAYLEDSGEGMTAFVEPIVILLILIINGVLVSAMCRNMSQPRLTRAGVLLVFHDPCSCGWRLPRVEC